MRGAARSMWPMRSRRTLVCVSFHAALLANHAAVLQALVLAAQALVVMMIEILAQNRPSRSGLNVR